DKMVKYGISFDIGTTTVVGNLWDLEKGTSLQIIGKTNPQIIFGADVISRINYCEDDSAKFKIIRDKITGCLNELIKELLTDNKIENKDIIKVTAAGNTTMSHIFSGFNPKPLARSPFTPAYSGEKVFKAREVGLNLEPETEVILLSNIAGHIGGDITAGILATRMEDLKGITLFIDIGTNGEIVLSKNDKIYACSTAAGPAFEGAFIYQGMRAEAGAIEKIKIKNGTVFFKTVENKEPEGICGSGIIRVIGELLKTGIINKSGRLLMPVELEEAQLSDDLKSRLRENHDGREFVIVFKKDKADIVITQKDIREVQLAKGAIHSGIILLLGLLNEEIKNVDRVILGGAFGNYLNKKSAVEIGILPDIDLNKIISAGNTAGTGASLVLLSEAERKKAIHLAEKTEHLELANCSNFQEEFLKSMSF
ncbi:MAG: DUF4445 domain-containing protein, partial [Peptostreptococcaceae bacterium]|nr:DUF4445 domain-containing protein [Peptostreptococcaceae bacterium]